MRRRKQAYHVEEFYQALDDLREIHECLLRAEEALYNGDDGEALNAIQEALEISQRWI
jgi:hypothetical protein